MTISQNKKLANSLRVLKKIQDKHHGVVESKDLTEEQRVLLLESGFLRLVMKGWYVCSNPADQDGDSTSWYASFWAFVSGYLAKRFGKRYCLNPEVSLLLHAGTTTILPQVTVITKEGGTSVIKLPFETSLLVYTDESKVPNNRVEVRGLQVWSIPEALCLVGPQFFKNYPQEAEIALSLIRDPSELLSILLREGGMPTAAARLAGAFAFMNRKVEAERIVLSMKRSGLAIYPKNPFDYSEPTLAPSREKSPYVLRLNSMWASWRKVVIDNFPESLSQTFSEKDYLQQIDERYVADAYNSLSIEGYRVTDELIERISVKGWDPENNEEDRKSKDAMAARGYFQAFNAVKNTIQRILVEPGKVGEIVKTDHHEWYGELFSPAVLAGILERHQLAGYRTGPVYIRNSKHTPVPRDAILDCMEALFDLLDREQDARVRAVLGHHLFVFIHPYFDGNGRIGRFLMNAIFASGKFPWTVIRVARRSDYMQALEKASVEGNILPLTKFICEEMQSSATSA